MTDTLSWTGGEPPERFIPGIPARDLDANDLERIVYRRTVGERLDAEIYGENTRNGGHKPSDPEFAGALDTVVADLVASGLYAKPSRKAKSEPTAPADPGPAQE